MEGSRVMQINWYPGHMSKAKRLLGEQLSRVDVAVELCDARLPLSSRNPDLDKMIGGKCRVLLLNKADLADPSQTKAWLALFSSQGIAAAAITASSQGHDAMRLITNAAREAVARAEARGIKKTVRAMVVGVPNVGKSTLINRLHGGAIAKVGEKPGVTRANQWVHITPYLELLDTPGMLWPRLNDPLAAKRLAYIAAIRDEVLDVPMLAMSLLEDLLTVIPRAAQERFKLTDPSLRGIPLLEAVCKGRGFLMRFGEPDMDRACAVILDEYRSGKLGRITLERA
jgi:ribosome biogenesis GTPase A